MAERSSTRTGNRRTTPQPVVEATQSTRATRRQSREVVSDNEIVKRSGDTGGKRKKAQNALQTAPKSRKRGLQDHQDLATVDENPTVEAEAEAFADDDQAIEADQGQLPNIDAKSSGRLSGISGTTARTSNVAQELADLMSGDLNSLEALVDLSESSRKLLSDLVPSRNSSASMSVVRSGLQDRRSVLNRRRNKFKVDFQSCRPDYSSATFITISVALPLLYGEKDGRSIQHTSQRPDPVFHAANLAVLASSVLVYPQQDDKRFLEDLDSYFPKAFTNAGNDTIQLAVDIRTQHAISLLKGFAKNPNFDSDIILKQVMCNEDGLTFRDFSFAKSQPKVAREARSLMLKQIEEVRHICEEGSLSTLGARLDKKYSWELLVKQIMEWVAKRNEEIKVQLERMDIEAVVNSLKGELEVMKQMKESSIRDGDDDDGDDDDDDDDDDNDESGYVDLSNIIPPMEPESAAVAIEGEEAEQPLLRPRDLAESIRATSYPKQGSPRLLHGAKALKQGTAGATRARMRALKLSGQLLPDEVKARVLSPVAPEAVPSTPGRPERVPHTPSPAPAGTRKDREAITDNSDDEYSPPPLGEDDDGDDGDDEDDDSDLAFQTQSGIAERTLKLRERRDAESNKENQAESAGAQPKKSLLDRQAGAERALWDSQDNSQEQGLHPSPHRSTSDRHALQPLSKRHASEHLAGTGQSPPKRPRVDEPPRPSQVYYQANAASKNMSALQPKAPQARKPWTEEETERLLELIEQYGISWKELKKQDRPKVLGDREQVALKDKARNMKFDYLKASRRLPVNFEKISLSKPLIERLRGFGVIYNTATGRREDAELSD